MKSAGHRTSIFITAAFKLWAAFSVLVDWECRYFINSSLTLLCRIMREHWRLSRSQLGCKTQIAQILHQISNLYWIYFVSKFWRVPAIEKSQRSLWLEYKGVQLSQSSMPQIFPKAAQCLLWADGSSDKYFILQENAFASLPCSGTHSLRITRSC